MTGLRVDLADGVLRLVLDRPEALNALDGALASALIHELENAAGRDDVRVVLIAGAGSAFSAGADLGGLGADADFEQIMAQAARLVRAVPRLDQPVVAAVRGVAAGVACGLVLACDVILTSESASFLLPFTRLGLMPDGGTTLTAAASLGRARAMRMALLSEPLSAQEAFEAGLVGQVVPEAELTETTDRVLARLAAGPPLSLAATKRAVNAATLGGLEDALAREGRGQVILAQTHDVGEGLRAFAERRPPRFTGA